MEIKDLTPPKNIPQAERIGMLLANGELIDIICDHVACGGSLIDLCRTWDVKYVALTRYIHGNKELDEKYSKALRDRGEWFKETVLNELRSLAQYDIRQIYKEDGSLKPVNEWPDDVAKAITSIESVELVGKKQGDIKKIKTESRKAAIESLGKTQAMFTEKVEHSAADSLASLISQTFNRNESDAKS